jgi:hypothetical protein
MFLNITCVNRSHKKKTTAWLLETGRVENEWKTVKPWSIAVEDSQAKSGLECWKNDTKWHKGLDGLETATTLMYLFQEKKIRLAFECTATVVNQNNSPGSTKQSSKLQQDCTSGRSWALSPIGVLSETYRFPSEKPEIAASSLKCGRQGR